MYSNGTLPLDRPLDAPLAARFGYSVNRPSVNRPSGSGSVKGSVRLDLIRSIVYRCRSP